MVSTCDAVVRAAGERLQGGSEGCGGWAVAVRLQGMLVSGCSAVVKGCVITAARHQVCCCTHATSTATCSGRRWHASAMPPTHNPAGLYRHVAGGAWLTQA